REPGGRRALAPCEPCEIELCDRVSGERFACDQPSADVRRAATCLSLCGWSSCIDESGVQSLDCAVCVLVGSRMGSIIDLMLGLTGRDVDEGVLALQP